MLMMKLGSQTEDLAAIVKYDTNVVRKRSQMIKDCFMKYRAEYSYIWSY